MGCFFLSGICFADDKPGRSITNKNLAVIVNDADPLSKEVAEYYRKKRLIPEENIIRVSFAYSNETMTVKTFNRVYKKVKKLTNKNIQAYVLTWTLPFRVKCMSITSAFALGFDEAYCAEGCKVTRGMPYYGINKEFSFKDYNVLPTMMLAGNTRLSIFNLIDRGVVSDYSRPKAKVYLLNTSSNDRTVRSVYFPNIERMFSKLSDVKVVNQDYLENKKDIMFYFTGMAKVKALDTNQFSPGAVADHLTSAGGMLFNTKQMSVLSWIDAGVTASYGTVEEPCNFLGKFPNPGVVMSNYLNGDALIEAYWKSVQMPGQGLFVGEPLASPYNGCSIQLNANGNFEFINKKPMNYVLRESANCH